MKNNKLFKALITTFLIVALTSVNIASAQSKTGQIPGIIAESAIVMDMDTGEVIVEKDANQQRPVASTIKLLTSLIFAENTSKTQMISFTQDSLKTTQTALNNFKKIQVGEQISSNDLMKAVMIFSANDAAYLMADSVAGNTKDFVKMMNDRVNKLGLKTTKIVNPCGLERDALNPNSTDINLSSAYDIAIIAKEAYKNEWIREIISEKYKNTSITISGVPILIDSRNKILGDDGNIGGKTGNETKAGHCFVGFFERDGRNLVTVALKSQYGADGTNVFNDTKKIADTGYTTKKQVLKKSGESIKTIELEYKVFGLFGPKKSIKVPIIATKDIMYYKNDINDKNIKFEYKGKDKNAWRLANKDVELNLSLPNYKSKVVGKVDLSLFDLVKANVGLYAISILLIAASVFIISYIFSCINSRKKKKSIMGGKRGRSRRRNKFNRF